MKVYVANINGSQFERRCLWFSSRQAWVGCRGAAEIFTVIGRESGAPADRVFEISAAQICS